MTFKIRNISLADDDEDDVDLFQLAVSETCDSLFLNVATNGTRMMRMLDDNPAPDAIFLDLNMQGKSGKECLEEIRNDVKFDAVPIMILSTSNSTSEIDYCMNHGADHYFVKSNSYDDLKAIIEDLCKGNLRLALKKPLM